MLIADTNTTFNYRASNNILYALVVLQNVSPTSSWRSCFSTMTSAYCRSLGSGVFPPTGSEYRVQGS